MESPRLGKADLTLYPLIRVELYVRGVEKLEPSTFCPFSRPPVCTWDGLKTKEEAEKGVSNEADFSLEYCPSLRSEES